MTLRKYNPLFEFCIKKSVVRHVHCITYCAQKLLYKVGVSSWDSTDFCKLFWIKAYISDNSWVSLSGISYKCVVLKNICCCEAWKLYALQKYTLIWKYSQYRGRNTLFYLRSLCTKSLFRCFRLVFMQNFWLEVRSIQISMRHEVDIESVKEPYHHV